MRDVHEGLIGTLAHLHFLFPQRVLVNDERADALNYQQIDDATASRMQILQDPAIALRRDTIKLAGGETLGFGKTLLLVSALLGVELVDRFDATAIDQARDKTCFVGGQGR